MAAGGPMPTKIFSSLSQSLAGAADSDVVRIKDGKIATARQSFFGRILRWISTSARDGHEHQSDSAIIQHSLLEELNSKFRGTTRDGENLADAAMRMAGIGAKDEAGRSTPITVRQIREAHACARTLSDQAKRSAAVLKAIGYSPTAPGFQRFAREHAEVDPGKLTLAQRAHYEYMLQKHVANDPSTFISNTHSLRKLAISTLRYVSQMSAEQIESALNDTVAQRTAATAVLDDLVSGAGVSSLAANLERLHSASNPGNADGMLGDAEYGAFMTLDVLAMERAVSVLTPQQARDAYMKAMASDGTGRAVLAAVDEVADDFGARSLKCTDRAIELTLDHSARHAKELYATTRLVLKTLGERGGIADVDEQLGVLNRKGPERTKAASGAIAMVRNRVNQAIAKKLEGTQSRPAARESTEGEGTLLRVDDENLQSTLQSEDRVPATQGGQPVRQTTEVFGDGFYQDMDRMHVVLASDGGETRIGTVAPTDHEPTEEEKDAAKLDGLDRLVEFVGDEALAARITRLIGQKLFAPMSRQLETPNSPIRLADGTHGQIQPVKGSLQRSFTLSKTSDGEIRVHVEQNYAARAMTTPDSVRELDGKRSYVKMGFDFSITRDVVRATSPVTYDFQLVEAQ
jgi:hypothetical protein